MKRLPSSRIIIAAVLLLLFLTFFVAILFITNLSFSVWEQLQQKPDWILWTYSLLIAFVSLIFGWWIWRFLLPKKNKITTPARSQAIEDLAETEKRLANINEKMAAQPEISKLSNDVSLLDDVQAESGDMQSEIAALQVELKNYEQRKTQKSIYIALFGDISSGKSSLIKALINDKAQQIETSVLGGTTREVVHYHWQTGSDVNKQACVLTDMPGLNEQFAQLDLLATEEVRRAHIAVYLCDGDLSASQFSELQAILELEKPCIVAINKVDRYSSEELQLIMERIRQRVGVTIPVLSISAGGMREFIRLTPDGDEERVQRPIEPDITSLEIELQKMINAAGIDQLERLREKSVSSMVNNKLDDLDARFKHSQSLRLVSNYTKKAVVASMATISPGTDLLVQGYLGIQMIKDLCKIYQVGATDIDANKLIELIQLRMDKTLPLLLAIAGNGLKAFPGIGTVSGGLMHAVAYGMIFDTLGRSIARTLEVTGELSPALVSDLYKEQLGENIESRTKDFIKLVLKLRNSD